MLFELGQEYLFRRAVCWHPRLRGPHVLQYHVVGVREEGRLVAVQNRLKKVTCTEAIVQKHLETLAKCRRSRRQPIQARQVRRSDSGTLEKPHRLHQRAIQRVGSRYFRCAGCRLIACRYSHRASVHFKCRYGQILPAETQPPPRRSTSVLIDPLSLPTSNNSSKAGTDWRKSEFTHPASGPFSQFGIGELNPTLRARMRIDSGIRPDMARRATIFVRPSPTLLSSGNAIV